MFLVVYTREYKNTPGDLSENEKCYRQKVLRSPSYERSAKYFYRACTKCRLQARHKMQICVENERTLRHRSTLFLIPSEKREIFRSLQNNSRRFLPKLIWQSIKILHVVNLTNEYFLLLIAIAVLSTSPGLRKEKKIGQDNNCELERVY